MREASLKEALKKKIGWCTFLWPLACVAFAMLAASFLSSPEDIYYVYVDLGGRILLGYIASMILATPFLIARHVMENYGRCTNCESWMKKTQYRCSDCDSEHRNEK